MHFCIRLEIKEARMCRNAGFLQKIEKLVHKLVHTGYERADPAKKSDGCNYPEKTTVVPVVTSVTGTLFGVNCLIRFKKKSVEVMISFATDAPSQTLGYTHQDINGHLVRSCKFRPT